MVTFWKRTAHSVNRLFSFLCIFVALVVSHLGFEDRTLVLIASVPGHCLPFTLFFYQKAISSFLIYQSSRFKLRMGHFGTSSSMQPSIMIKCRQ